MKKHLLFSFLAFVLFLQTGISQTYIWGGPGDKNSEFNGGLNDWTTSGDPAGAKWVWKANGKADQGTFWNNRSAIKSPSVSNGAAVFDSDYYDSKGNIKAPHTSYLISPTISCSGYDSIYLQFNQYMRMFASKVSIEFSIDNGNHWELLKVVNDNYTYQGESNTDSKILIKLPASIDGKGAVKFRFVFAPSDSNDKRCYYFWIIDDVSLVINPQVDPQILGTWYPSMHYNIPQYMADRDSMHFIMDIGNGGNQIQSNIESKVTMYHAKSKKVYFADTKDFDLSLDSTRVYFNSYLLPSNCDTGIYYVDYEIKGENFASNMNKIYRQIFRINPEIFEKKEDNFNIYNTGFSNSDEDLYDSYFGSNKDHYNLSYYKVGNWVENPNLKIIAVSSSFSIAEGQNDLTSFPANLSLHEISDDIDNLLSNFDENDGLGGTDASESKQLTFIGYSYQTVANVKNFSKSTVPLYDLETNEIGVSLKPNKKYFIAMHWEPSTTTYYCGVDNENGSSIYFKRYYYLGSKCILKNDTLPQQIVSLSYQPGNNGGFYLPTGTNYGNLIYQLDLGLNVWKNTSSLTDEDLLPSNSLNIIQNPVYDQLSVEIKFNNKVEHATLLIHDLNGSLLNMRNIYNTDKANEEFKTGHYPAGEYIITLFTKDKLISKKFVVVK